MTLLRLSCVPAVFLAAVLAGCATTPPDATVQVFTPPPRLAAGSTYRLERLPLQASQPGQAELEMAADAALARAGLRRDDTAPRLAVQVAASQDRLATGPAWGGPSVGIGIGGGGGGGGVGIGFGIPIGGGVRSSQRVDVQVRDAATGQVVYQSQASGGPGASPAALVDAALRDFPNAPSGVRQVPLAAGPAR
jgi:hypothetical protein